MHVDLVLQLPAGAARGRRRIERLRFPPDERDAGVGDLVAVVWSAHDPRVIVPEADVTELAMVRSDERQARRMWRGCRSGRPAPGPERGSGHRRIER